MNLFPFIAGTDTTTESINNETYKEYDFDFETGKLSGKVLEGKEALKVWICKALITKRYVFDIYTWDYGNDLEELIGQGYDIGFIDSEVERRIKDCLLVNEKINGCHSFDISLVNDNLNVNFTVDTIFGEVKINV